MAGDDDAVIADHDFSCDNSTDPLSEFWQAQGDLQVYYELCLPDILGAYLVALAFHPGDTTAATFLITVLSSQRSHALSIDGWATEPMPANTSLARGGKPFFDKQRANFWKGDGFAQKLSANSGSR